MEAIFACVLKELGYFGGHLCFQNGTCLDIYCVKFSLAQNEMGKWVVLHREGLLVLKN